MGPAGSVNGAISTILQSMAAPSFKGTVMALGTSPGGQPGFGSEIEASVGTTGSREKDREVSTMGE